MEVNACHSVWLPLGALYIPVRQFHLFILIKTSIQALVCHQLAMRDGIIQGKLISSPWASISPIIK